MAWTDKYVEFAVLKGKTLSDVSVDLDEIVFTTVDGECYKLYHEQDCCESVYIESIVGDVSDLVNEEILLAEEGTNLFDVIRQAHRQDEEDDVSETWTFYKLATRKGYVDIRWYGSSNGYYSESVSFVKEGVDDED